MTGNIAPLDLCAGACYSFTTAQQGKCGLFCLLVCFSLRPDAGSFGDSAKAEDHEIDRCDSAPAREGPPASQYPIGTLCVDCIACERM